MELYYFRLDPYSIIAQPVILWCDLSHTKGVTLITKLSTDSIYTKFSQIE